MLGFVPLLVLSLTLAVTLAAPTPPRPRAVTLPLHRNSVAAQHAHGRRSIQRRPEPPPPGVGAFDLASFGTQYSIQVQVGTPPQPLDLMFDTGSPALWIMDECIVTDQCEMSKLFTSPSSSTLSRSRESWGMSYGAGEVSGVVASDIIGIGDMSARTTIGLVSSIPNWGHAASGLIGFGPSSSYAIPPWWAGVIDTWPKKQFGFFVGRTADWDVSLSSSLSVPDVPAAGSLTLGGVDPSLFVGELKGTPSNLTKWWTVGIDAVRVNGHKIDIDLGLEGRPYGAVGEDNNKKPSAFLDTGLSGLVGPSKAVRSVYAAIPGSFSPDGETYFLPHRLAPSTLDAYAQLEVEVEFCFAGDCWAANLVDKADCRTRSAMMEHFATQVVEAEKRGISADTWCTGTLLPDDEAGDEFPQWSLGNAFLQNWYIAHQFDPPEVQIAPLSRKARGMVKEADIGLNRVLGG